MTRGSSRTFSPGRPAAPCPEPEQAPSFVTSARRNPNAECSLEFSEAADRDLIHLLITEILRRLPAPRTSSRPLLPRQCHRRRPPATQAVRVPRPPMPTSLEV